MPRGIKGSGPTKTVAVPVVEPMVMMSIDLTPSWHFTALALATNLLDGKNYDVRRKSHDEVIRMGLALDGLLKFVESKGQTIEAREYVRGLNGNSSNGRSNGS